MANARIDISGEVEALTSGQLKMVLPTIVLTTAVGDVDVVNLASGDNTITLATATSVLVIIPPTTNAQTLTMKGVTGDTGLLMDPAKPFVYCRAAGTTEVILVAGGIVNGTEIWQF